MPSQNCFSINGKFCFTWLFLGGEMMLVKHIIKHYLEISFPHLKKIMLRTCLIQEILVELLRALVTGILKQSMENIINKNPSATKNLSKCNDS